MMGRAKTKSCLKAIFDEIIIIFEAQYMSQIPLDSLVGTYL